MRTFTSSQEHAIRIGQVVTNKTTFNRSSIMFFYSLYFVGCVFSVSQPETAYSIGHFRVPLCLCFKASLSGRPFFNLVPRAFPASIFKGKSPGNEVDHSYENDF